MKPAVIKKIRSDYQKTQTQLAQIIGVSTSTVSLWESGKKTPKGLHEELLSIMRSALKKDPEIPNYVRVGKPSKIIFTILDMHYGNRIAK